MSETGDREIQEAWISSFSHRVLERIRANIVTEIVDGIDIVVEIEDRVNIVVGIEGDRDCHLSYRSRRKDRRFCGYCGVCGRPQHNGGRAITYRIIFDALPKWVVEGLCPSTKSPRGGDNLCPVFTTSRHVCFVGQFRILCELAFAAVGKSLLASSLCFRVWTHAAQ